VNVTAILESSTHKDYDPFGTGQGDQASSYEVKAFATAYHEPESMNQVLLAPQSIEVDKYLFFFFPCKSRTKRGLGMGKCGFEL
jgi:hypothetical protein